MCQSPLATQSLLKETEILASYDTPEKKTHQGAAIWAYKINSASGRIVNIGSHPEGITSGERLALTEACFMYALDGTGQPKIKGSLVNGEVRSMNQETTDKNPAFTKIGDRQTHHFRFDVASGRQPVQIELTGQEGFDDTSNGCLKRFTSVRKMKAHIETTTIHRLDFEMP